MKDKITHKAAEMFITLGFKSVTMDDIANELAISKKTIYAHFKNKTELVHEVTMSLFSTISCGIDHICDLQKNPIEELYEIKKLVMMHLKNERTSPQYQLQKFYPEIHEALKAKHYQKMSECTLGNLKRGVAMGLYRENLDIDFVSRIYFIGVNGIKDEALFPVQKFPKVRLFEDYLEYHLRGIVTKEGLKTLNKFIKTTMHNA
ncbi:MAG: TetR/AcrR family transcriptional regulator [Bacteroidia bacterium]|nr:TetR/AcrR family transcriptional regulator [Bacteroidia bacterium]NNF30764.1 TetR/AcrR family transcriptional regulator [Flavobacteriaceae bacterium]MBT8277191.1 TetR/AcrR family transcriptional regulator [Bacteroidia bacterium]NNJ81442.1 TetR/AcrR family transcriptional regulator [Flavobacteriaceae bacterium]NNK54768.1 TetR/AcrR family transcriptional regulator [Flavobacteriaceae bacterium]